MFTSSHLPVSLPLYQLILFGNNIIFCNFSGHIFTLSNVHMHLLFKQYLFILHCEGWETQRGYTISHFFSVSPNSCYLGYFLLWHDIWHLQSYLATFTTVVLTSVLHLNGVCAYSQLLPQCLSVSLLVGRRLSITRTILP